MLLSGIPRLTILAHWNMCPCADKQPHMVLEKGEGHCPITLQNCWFAFKSMISSYLKFKSKNVYKVWGIYRMVYKSGRCEIFCFFVTILFISSVRSSISHPDLFVIQRQHHPTFSDIACRLSYNIIGLSLSEQLELYQKQSLDLSAGYIYILCAIMCNILQDIIR